MPLSSDNADHRVTSDRVKFAAPLSLKAKVISWGVGVGVLLGVPLLLGIMFHVISGDWEPLVLPAVMVVVLPLIWLHRITGYSITDNAVIIDRPMRPCVIPLADIREVHTPASLPRGVVIGRRRIEGIFGTQGSYWSREWGTFLVYVTNDQDSVEIRLQSGQRMLISPHEPERFVQVLRAALEQAQDGNAPGTRRR